MYSFAKGMGGSGSDRLSDQDAKYALEALQSSGLLNTQKGMNLIMNALIRGMSRREQVISGLVSEVERQVIGGMFLDDVYDGNSKFSIENAVMDAWASQYEVYPVSVNGYPGGYVP